VVTLIANYLTTQLPNQMAINDANHVLTVEDQLGRLAASLEAASVANAIERVVSQPVSLGTQGAPPFAAPDGSSIGPGTVGSGITESYTVTRPLGRVGWIVIGTLFGRKDRRADLRPGMVETLERMRQTAERSPAGRDQRDQ